MGFFFGHCGSPTLPPSRPCDEYTVSRFSFCQLMEMLHMDFQRLPCSCTIIVFLVFGIPGNLTEPGSGLLSEQVRHVSSLLPALVCCLTYLTKSCRPVVCRCLKHWHVCSISLSQKWKIEKKERKKNPDCSIWFTWHEYSHHGWFQPTKMISLNPELGRGPH